MKSQQVLCTLLLLLLTSVPPSPTAHERAVAQSVIYFDPSNPDFMLMGNADYEISISKINGALLYILDKATGEHVSAGSRYDCLWGSIFAAVAQPDDYVGGCLYHRDNANRLFTWTWYPADSRLNLCYLANPASYAGVNVRVDITLSADPWFDLRLFLENKSGYTIERVLFPSDLMFLTADMQELLMPVMPGVVLEPGIFDVRENYSYVVRYPGWPGVFADYQALTSAKGRFAMYTLHKPDEIITTWIGPIEDSQHPGSFYLYHTYHPGIPNRGLWESPMVRIHIGQLYPQTLAAYRAHNHFTEFPDLRAKTGPQYERLVKSPLIKADTDRPISVYATLLPQIPSPAILHWVSFWQHGFDENYPDLLPPKSEFGTTAEMAALFRTASAAGFFNMPYTNPTWWDDEAPTLQGLSPTTVAVLDRSGTPQYECYTGSTDAPPCTPENAARGSAFNAGRPAYQWLHGGYAVSPHVDVVQQRLAQLMQQMIVDLPSDLIFEDQIGARAMDFDYNPAAPHIAAYHQGWLEHTRVYSANLLMTEAGYDRLSEAEIGFHGSYLLSHVTTQSTTDWWGDGNWHVFPLTAFLTRDKTLFYQHNLAPETFTYNLATLRWNLATGYMLSYDIHASEYGGGLDSPWLKLVSIVQSEVLSRYADELATNFQFLAPDVSLTTFETFSVTANWNKEVPYAVDTHLISPGGVYVSNHRDIIAGMFMAYNGVTLTGTEHFIVERRTLGTLTVWKPLGTSTSLEVLPLSGWADGNRVLVEACNREERCFHSETAVIANHRLQFTYTPVFEGQDVWCYKLTKVIAQVYLPLVLK